ncbi:MAG: MBL fold metallo-hydrolase [Flavisolibacter sp.]
MLLKTFGKNPDGEELKKVEGSMNYKGGQFENLTKVEMMKGTSMIPMLWKFMNKPKNTKPLKLIPTIKTNLKELPEDAPAIVWFGHSSYLIKINGKYILVDPVLSGHASPFSFGGKSFPGADAYTVDDLPDIDVLLISHDHYDHLDYETVMKLQHKVGRICTSLGVVSHLIYWGIAKEKVVELDWWDSHEFSGGLQLTAVPARHFSGRTFVRNKTLWSAFVLKAAGHSIFIGADSGYGEHFKMIGEKYGPFEIAILECGQYNIAWHDIHMMPEETVQACIDLNADVLMPVHWGKFSISLHPWDEPIQRVIKKAEELKVKITTPMIGEVVKVGGEYTGKKWWE